MPANLRRVDRVQPRRARASRLCSFQSDRLVLPPPTTPLNPPSLSQPVFAMAVSHSVPVAKGVVAPAHLPAEGSAAFNNWHYIALVLLAPKLLQWTFPFLAGSRTIYTVLLVLLFLPVTIFYWWASSNYGARLNDKVRLPGKPIGDYLEFKDEELRKQYLGRKIPYQVLHDAYFEDKVAFKGASRSLSGPPLAFQTGRRLTELFFARSLLLLPSFAALISAAPFVTGHRRARGSQATSSRSSSTGTTLSRSTSHPISSSTSSLPSSPRWPCTPRTRTSARSASTTTAVSSPFPGSKP
jgi:hypothetical protein